jgi:hypothetical protein
MSDSSPECAPKRTSTGHSEFMMGWTPLTLLYGFGRSQRLSKPFRKPELRVLPWRSIQRRHPRRYRRGRRGGTRLRGALPWSAVHLAGFVPLTVPDIGTCAIAVQVRAAIHRTGPSIPGHTGT